MMMQRVLTAIVLAAALFAVSVSAQESPETPAQIPPAQALALSVLEVVSEEIERLTMRMQEGDGWNEDIGQSLAANMRIAALLVDAAFGESLEMAISEVGGEDAFVAEMLTGGHLERELQELGIDGVQFPPMTMDELRKVIADFRENGFSDVFEEAAAVLGGEGLPGSAADSPRTPTGAPAPPGR